MKAKNLKLIAKTDEDLRVISAHLQDSIASTENIANLKKNKIFLMQLNRFMWEDVEKGVFRKNKRIRTMLKFDNVIEVSSKNISQKNKNKFLDFLAIESYKMPDNNYEMKLVFSGDSIIKIIAEVIEVTLDDQGESWDTKNQTKTQSELMIKYINGNIKNFDIKLDVILNKRKFLQTNQSKNTRLIIQDVKKRGDKALLKYEKKFSKILKNNNKIKFSKKEINDISKKTDPKLKKSIDIALTRIKKIPFKAKIFTI